MVISFLFNQKEALKEIRWTKEKKIILIETEKNSDDFVIDYGKAKWAIVDLLNEKYSKFFVEPIDLYNWLKYNSNDEVSYFLNEAGSNALNYAEQKKPTAFHLWLGEKGFVMGIEQEKKGFDAVRVDSLRLRENEGAGFDFFRNCRGKVFFDNRRNARLVYFMQLF